MLNSFAIFSKSNRFLNKNVLYRLNRCENVSNFKRPQKLYFQSNWSLELKSKISGLDVITPREWKHFRSNILTEGDRNINEVNIDAMILGMCLNERGLKIGKSYIDFLKVENLKPNVGALGKLLRLYYSNEKDLDDNDREYILKLCDELTTSYDFLDSTTLEHVILSYCTTNEWRKSLKLLDDIKITSTPSGMVYSKIVSRAFAEGDLEIGWQVLNDLVLNNRIPRCQIFISWFQYCNQFDSEPQFIDNIEKMLTFIGDHDVHVSKAVANLLWSIFRARGLESNVTSINGKGECISCKTHLKKISITKSEFERLSDAFLDKVLIRKNIFLKSSPEEVEKFETFLNKTMPFDIVIDGLNVAFSSGIKKSNVVYAKLLSAVVKHFSDKRKHILVLGRIHMNKWPKNEMNYVRQNSSIFLTDDISQDDPYLLYAAIKSGPSTDFFSRDLMRSHSFLLGKDLGPIFRRWQQLHQYQLIHATDYGKIIIRDPIKLSTNAHKVKNTWHVPFDEEFDPNPSDGFEIAKNWLCIKLK